MKIFVISLGTSLLFTLINIRNLIDGDTLWAIKVGEWISANRGVPFCDMFSWTAYGNPWVAHEWLFDLLIYKFHSYMGFQGIVVFFFIGLTILFFLLWKTYYKEDKNTAQTALIFIIVITMMNNLLNSFFLARPHIYGLVFFVYFLYVLLQNQKLLYTLPLVTIIWANMHGSVVLGIAMVLLQLIYETAFNLYDKTKPVFNIKLILTTFLVVMFSLINPYGIKLWESAFWQITNSVNHQIYEWQPPDFGETALLTAYLAIIITTVLVSFIKRKAEDKRRLVIVLIYLAVTFYVAFSGVRYFPYLAVCWGLFMLKHLPDEVLSSSKFLSKIAAVLASIFIVLLVVVSWGKYPNTIDDSIQKKAWPQEAVKQLEQKETFNEYVWGGYLIFNNIPVFIDGRADVYCINSEVFQDYIDTVRFKKDPMDIFDKYQVKQVIISADTPLDFYLKKAGWMEKYRDKIAVIYLKV